MAKKKKKRSAPRPMPKKAAAPRKPIHVNWKLIAILAALVALVIICTVLALGQKKFAENTSTEGTGYTSPLVDTSNLTPMRIVKPGSAYVMPDKNSPTVFSFRKGDKVDVVSREGQWTTIAVEGRGYYLPNEALRALDEYLIVIDPGHQMYEDHGKEAIGPGGAETEIRMDIGHTGVATKQAEYELNLAVAKQLRTILEQRGYQVVMTHSNPATKSSYIERTEVANKLHADAYISLHANSSEDTEVRGMFTMCQSKENTYNAEMYTQNRELSNLILDAMAETTKATKLKIQETDKHSGINWCQVPMTIVQMGHLSNADEDRLLTTEAYRQKIAEGIANGLDQFFSDEK